MARKKNGIMTSIMTSAAAELLKIFLVAKKSGTPKSTAGVKHSICLFVRFKKTFDSICDRSFGINAD